MCPAIAGGKRHQLALERARQKLDETQQRYSRT